MGCKQEYPDWEYKIAVCFILFHDAKIIFFSIILKNSYLYKLKDTLVAQINT